MSHSLQELPIFGSPSSLCYTAHHPLQSQHLTGWSTSGRSARSFCWQSAGSNEKVCLFMRARRLVFTRMDSGVSTSISAHLVLFKWPVKGRCSSTLHQIGNLVRSTIRPCRSEISNLRSQCQGGASKAIFSDSQQWEISPSMLFSVHGRTDRIYLAQPTGKNERNVCQVEFQPNTN